MEAEDLASEYQLLEELGSKLQAMRRHLFTNAKTRRKFWHRLQGH